MSIENVLYTATATATGGREGRAVSSDGVLDVALTMPKGLGGAGGPGTNPEQLFAAGYSACFLGALKLVAGKQKVALPADTTVTGKVGIGAIPTGFGIEVELTHQRARRAARAAAGAGRCGAHRLPVLERHPRQHRREPGRSPTDHAASRMQNGHREVAVFVGDHSARGSRRNMNSRSRCSPTMKSYSPANSNPYRP